MRRHLIGRRILGGKRARRLAVQRGTPRRQQLRSDRFPDDRMRERQRRVGSEQIGGAERIRGRLGPLALELREHRRVAQR